MKSSAARRSKKGPPDKARTPPGAARRASNRRAPARPAAAIARAGREQVPVARESTVASGEHPLGVQKDTIRAPHTPSQTREQTDRLMGQMREANERLIVAAVQALNLADEAHVETAQAREELNDLMNQMRAANERLAAGAVLVHTMADEAREHEEEYRRLSSRLLTLQDEERRRLALDLHDPIGQRLAALAINLDVIEQTAKALDARSRRALAESRSLADQCAREVRTFAYLLYPPLLDEVGLVSAVRWYAEGFAKRSGIHVVMDLGEVGRLPEPIETAIFRVVQEALTNVHRHASTTTAAIRLTSTANAVVLEIHDQGRGLRDPGTPPNGASAPETMGVGIQGMRERIRQLGGTFDVTFTGRGTTVRVSVPLKAS
jgi:signal transduction histidine kinase